MHKAADQAIQNRNQRHNGQKHARGPTIKGGPYTTDKQNQSEEDRRIHDLLAIAANVVLVGYFQTTE